MSGNRFFHWFNQNTLSLAAPTNAAKARSWRVVVPTVLIWLVVGWTAGYWVLHSLGPAPASPAVVVPIEPLPATAFAAPVQTLALLGGAKDENGEGSRGPASARVAGMRLLGTVANEDGFGAALIAMDGVPAKPYRIGAVLGDGLVLEAIFPAKVRISGAELHMPTSTASASTVAKAQAKAPAPVNAAAPTVPAATSGSAGNTAVPAPPPLPSELRMQGAEQGKQAQNQRP